MESEEEEEEDDEEEEEESSPEKKLVYLCTLNRFKCAWSEGNMSFCYLVLIMLRLSMTRKGIVRHISFIGAIHTTPIKATDL